MSHSAFPFNSVETFWDDDDVVCVLIKRAITAKANGHQRWFGMKPGQIAKKLGRPNEWGKVLSCLERLEQAGRVYSIQRKKNVRWFPASSEIVRAATHDEMFQTKLDEMPQKRLWAVEET